MVITKKQAEQVREQLISGIESAFPDYGRETARKQIETLSDEQLEDILKKNSSKGCPLCAIAGRKIESFKVAESSAGIAVLEPKPASRGHIIILPILHSPIEESPQLLNFASEVVKDIKEKFSPKGVEMVSMNIEGHGVINLVPVYKNESIKSQRHEADKRELRGIYNIFKGRTENPAAKKPEEKKEEKPKEEPKKDNKPEENKKQEEPKKETEEKKPEEKKETKPTEKKTEEKKQEAKDKKPAKKHTAKKRTVKKSPARKPTSKKKSK